MSRVQLYVEEDSMSRAVVRGLRARGADVVTALDVGVIQRPDEEHLEWATANDRVLYSFNLADFYHLHTEWLLRKKSHAGLILAQQQRHPTGDLVRRLLRLIATRSAEQMRNQVEFLGNWG